MINKFLENKNIRLAIFLKLQELRRTSSRSIMFENIEDILIHFIWRNNEPTHLYGAVNDILKITGEDIVEYLAMQAKMEESRSNIKEFKTLLGRNDG